MLSLEEQAQIRLMILAAQKHPGTTASLRMRGCHFGYAEYTAEFIARVLGPAGNRFITRPRHSFSACTLPEYRLRRADDRELFAEVAALVGAPREPTSRARWWRLEIADTWTWPLVSGS